MFLWEWSLYYNEYYTKLSPIVCLAPVISGLSFSYTTLANYWKSPGYEQLIVSTLLVFAICYYLFIWMHLSLLLTCKHFKVNDYNLSFSLSQTCLEMATMYNCWFIDHFPTHYIKESQYIKTVFGKKSVIIGNKSKASLSYLLCQVSNIILMEQWAFIVLDPYSKIYKEHLGNYFSPKLIFELSATPWLWQRFLCNYGTREVKI